jgi:hypothetical protein
LETLGWLPDRPSGESKKPRRKHDPLCVKRLTPEFVCEAQFVGRYAVQHRHS